MYDDSKVIDNADLCHRRFDRRFKMDICVDNVLEHSRTYAIRFNSVSLK